MSKKAAAALEEKPDTTQPDKAVRRELDRILVSKSFRQVDRLQRFLAFIVEETLEGRGDILKEYPVGVEVFGRDPSFDPRMDPIVRVQARRLRTRLAAYYKEEGHTSEVIIELPKGGYTPVFRRVESSATKKPLTAALVSRNTVSVLPFLDQTVAGDELYFCAGVAQEITFALSRLESVLVVSADAEAAGIAPSPAALVVSGSVRKSRDTLRITTHITDSLRGCYIWSDSVDRSNTDIFAVQEEIAQTVAESLRLELFGGGVAKGSRHRRSENLAAQNMYLQGRYHLNQRTEHGLRKALEFFTKATEEDPQLGAAHAGMADAYILLSHYGVALPVEVWTKSAAKASEAVLVDDESSEAHTSLGHLKSAQDWDWAGAEREFRRAISLNPRNATAHHWYAVSCLAPLGRLDEAMEEILMAQALDPVSSIIARDIAQIHYYQRNFDLALDQCDHTIEQNPHFFAAYWTLGLVQEQRGEYDEAAAAFKRAIELAPPGPRILGALGRTLAKDGKRQEALDIIAQLDQMSKTRYISPFEIALIYFALDRLDAGFQRLATAYSDRSFELLTIHIDPRFDSVRNDPRFVELSRKLELP